MLRLRIIFIKYSKQKVNIVKKLLIRNIFLNNDLLIPFNSFVRLIIILLFDVFKAIREKSEEYAKIVP